MRLQLSFAFLAVALCLPVTSMGAPLYLNRFETDTTASWTVNNNGAGTNAANFFFDYSTVGIPPAPNSGPLGTMGLKIGANLNSATAPGAGIIPGISVSPTGKSFTGDYTLKFDWWHNYIGPLNVGATGSTMLSTYGVMTSGTSANYAGTSDSVFFAATGDGQSSSDFRIYSSERPTSYQAVPPSVNPLDLHATYPAGSTNQTAPLYTATFPAGATAPGNQATNFPTQSGATSAGAAGFRWHEVEIEKIGPIVNWYVNGVLLGSTNTALYTGTLPAGSNILFGHSDTNLTTNSNAALLEALQFTLIDNVRVVVPEPSSAVLCLFGLMGLLIGRRRS
jgi:hypothetical protein